LTKALNARLAQIVENPQRFPFSLPGRRWVQLARFPYQIHYLGVADSIVILVFWHEKRDRKTLHRRLADG
jgi:hypothetical protein